MKFLFYPPVCQDVNYYKRCRAIAEHRMTETSILILFVAGALVQCALGIGFSVVTGPALILALGAKAAVPVLLALNLLVSAFALFRVQREDWAVAVKSLGWVVFGLLIGAATFSVLSTLAISLIVAVILLVAAIPPQLLRAQPPRGAVEIAAVLTGLATCWTATPGPIMALGFIWGGVDGTAVRRVVQPLAFVCYGTALSLHGQDGRAALVALAAQPLSWLAVSLGSALGLALGSRLPSNLIVPGLRVIAALAGLFLLFRSLAS
jgi:uncharacterized protein